MDEQAYIIFIFWNVFNDAVSYLDHAAFVW
jgi:hypothetical protein